MAYPRYRKARSHKLVNYSGGDLSLTATTWTDLPVSGALDIAIPASVGDTLVIGWSAMVTPGSRAVFIDVGTVVGGSIVNHLSDGLSPDNAREGIQNMTVNGTGNPGRSGPFMYDVVSGDISGGKVTVRPRYRLDAGGTQTMYASASRKIQFNVQNIGPQAPH